VYNITAAAWYNIGLWVSVAAGRLRLELIGGSGYDNSVDSQYQTGGVTTIYASILNNSSAARANCGGTWKHDGALACVSAVKFVQGADRFSYYVYVNLNSYTEHGLKIDTTKGSGFTPSFTVTTDPGANSATVQAAAFTMITGYGSSSTVGIGVTNPGSLFTVYGNNAISGSIALTGPTEGSPSYIYKGLAVPAGNTGTRPYLGLTATNSTAQSNIFLWGDQNNIGPVISMSTTQYQFWNSAQTSQYMPILSSGNVGIGTTSPTASLHVMGDDRQATLLLDGNSKVTGRAGIAISSNVTNGGNNWNIWSTLTGEGPGGGALAIYNQTQGAFRMVINNTGNVGIGTASPTVKLDIVGALKTSTNSTNYVVGTGSAVTINSTTPTTVASATLTTNGKPIFVMCSGDLQPVNNLNDWCYIRLYRDSTAIGNLQIDHPNTNPSANEVFAIHAIDVPGAGTYTYTCKAYQGVGNIQFGEAGVPYLTAYEFI